MNASEVPLAARFDAARMLTQRLKVLAPNPITAAMVRSAELRRQGRDVVNFSVGEPDFDTPEPIREAAVRAMNAGQTRYTATDGAPELKEAVRRKFARENGLEYGLDQISVGSGAKQVIYNALACTLEPGDEVVIPAPYWTSYPEVAAICGGTPIIVACAPTAKFKMTPEDLRSALSSRTKWVILNSPSNPTGAAYSAEELRRLAEVVLGHPSAMILADDIYEHLLYRPEPFVSMACAAPAVYDRTLTVNGVSKTYAMTGWRIGYGAGPAPLIRAMLNLQSQATSNPCSISQAAAIAALNGPQDLVERWRAVFRRRRDLVLEGLAGAPRLCCDTPDGAFYAYVDCHRVMGLRTPAGPPIASDRDFTDYLLESQCVATVHGAAFGLSPFLRLSYATSEERIVEGCRRIRVACEALR